MGDRAYVELTCREADAALFERAGFLEEFRCGLPSGLVTMVDVEAPDGNITPFETLPARGSFFADGMTPVAVTTARALLGSTDGSLRCLASTTATCPASRFT